MDRMMTMSDLVLESRPGEWKETGVKVILPNIKGQRYAFGSKYPGEREGEEFIVTRNGNGLLDPTHSIIISVDDQGQYWIQNDTRTVEGKTTRSSVYNTFVNNERVKAVEIRRLKSGDRITFGDPKSRLRRHYVFCVTERTIEGSGNILRNENEGWISVGQMMSFADSPLTNNLILAEIMSYLPVSDLKRVRLVSKKWGEEASKSIEKRVKVSFTFYTDYLNPEYSTRVFRYLHEMRDMKMRNLHITLSTYNTILNPGQKMLDDLRKLLKSSNNFSTLSLRAYIREESDFLLFSIIFQELGGKLEELTLYGRFQFFPKVNPSFPFMKSLKKFTDHGSTEKAQWISLLVSLFPKGLEHFTSEEHMADPYLQAFLNTNMPNLRGIAIKGYSIRKTSLTLLLALKNPLTSLEIHCYPRSEEEVGLVEKLLLKHSSSLQTLVISILFPLILNKDTEIRFPSFPKLVELELEYSQSTRVRWDTDLDYKKHFPSLKKLRMGPSFLTWSGRREDAAFNAFFPQKGGERVRCETVMEVWIPVLPNLPCCWLYRNEVDFQPRMDQIRKMFPSAGRINFFCSMEQRFGLRCMRCMF